MAFIEFIKQACTSILIGYLAFTNMLATHLQSFFPDSTVTYTENFKLATAETFERISDSTQRVTEIPRTLLDHSEFQRAALYASKLKEEDTSIDPKSLDSSIRDALVNVFCQYKTDTYIRTTTGTGFIINKKGIILTNAHVAQFLLLKDTKSTVKEVNCVIRTGDPATAKYSAELLYISPKWIVENANLIATEAPKGTGERDYALLYISKSLDNKPLPSKFPSIPVDTALLSRGVQNTSVKTAGYPAETLMRSGADAKLVPVVASTKVGTLYTFGSNYADIFSISESAVGEQGASGGPIVTEDSMKAIGLIVTKGDTKLEGAHSLRAITLSYVDRTIQEETGYSLKQNMQGDPSLRGKVFKKAMVPFLAELLEDELKAGRR